MAQGPLKVIAYSQDDKIKLDEGKLGLVNNEILQTTGTIRLKAEFPNHGASALAGRAGQCPAAAGDAPGRPHGRRSAVQQGPKALMSM